MHGLAHLFDVLDGGNGLPLGIPGADGEPAPFPGHVLPHDLNHAVFRPDRGPAWPFPPVQVDRADAWVTQTRLLQFEDSQKARILY